MTRLAYDQFSKQLLKELLERFGRVETSKDVAAEVRQIDFFFVPSPENQKEREMLGLLGRLSSAPSVFEPFRNAVQPREVRDCIGKLYSLHKETERQYARENKPLPEEDDLPQLWILTPTASVNLLEGIRAEEEREWPDGVNLLGPTLKAAVVVIHQLPVTPETLWLRLLGRGKVQQLAIEELRGLPDDNPFRLNALELVYNLLAILKARKNSEPLEPEDEELIVELSPIYTEQLETATQKGIQQGQRLMVESILQVKFGESDLEVKQIIEPLTKLPALESTKLIMQLSREELLERFSS